MLNNKADSDLGKATTNQDWDWKDIKITVWVNAKTDLPIEFYFSRTGEDFETTYRFTDLKWNPEFSDEAFQPTAPGSDYTELVK